MNPLEQILASTKATQQRTSSMGKLLQLLSAPDPAPSTPAPAQNPTAAPAAPGGGSYAPTHGGLNPQFAAKLNQMIRDSGGRLSIKSGYRSPEEQAALYAKGVQQHGADVGRWVAPPGHSNHNLGLAVDLGFNGGDAVAWAHQNAARYGLNFPLPNENWHIEPVGIRK